MSEDYHRKMYPDLFEAYDKREGDKALKATADNLFKNIRPMREALEMYDNEEKRGIVHNVKYMEKMENFRKEILNLQKNAMEAMEKWQATTPHYDPDNHVGSCGCIVKNGKRVYWCGDHY